MNHFYRTVLCLSLLVFCWLTMQATHELGHVCAGIITGGSVERVVLHPLTFSRTDMRSNPSPQIELWGGAIGGILFPLLIWGIWKGFRLPEVHILRFWVGFCLIANGAYFGGDFSQRGPTDAGLLTELETGRLSLVCFGIIAIALGLVCWNGQSRYFGWGHQAIPVRWHTALSLFCLMGMIIILEVIIEQY